MHIDSYSPCEQVFYVQTKLSLEVQVFLKRLHFIAFTLVTTAFSHEKSMHLVSFHIHLLPFCDSEHWYLFGVSAHVGYLVRHPYLSSSTVQVLRKNLHI